MIALLEDLSGWVAFIIDSREELCIKHNLTLRESSEHEWHTHLLSNQQSALNHLG